MTSKYGVLNGLNTRVSNTKCEHTFKSSGELDGF
jgi:hypothetical protein